MMVRTFSVTAIAAAILSSTSGAYAQDGDATIVLDEIIVTAQKQEQIQFDVPINLSVVGQDLIDNYNLNEIEKLSDFVPGLQVQSQSVDTPSYTLRGVVSDGGAPRVAIFHNGIAIADPRSGQNLALFDMERVEIVKGPQATLFGQGALVGGINFINNRAVTEEDSGFIRLEAGNFGAVRAEGFVNFAVNDSFAVRLAGTVRERDGFIENLGDGPDLGGGDQLALRGALHFSPSERFRADIIFNYQDDESTGTPFQSGAISPTGGPIDLFGPIAQNVNADQAARRDTLGLDRDVNAITADLEYKVNDKWTLTSITDYREIDASQTFDADATRLNILGFYNDDQSEAFSQELRLNYDSGERLRAFAGINYFNVETQNISEFSTNVANFQAIFSNLLAGSLGADVPTFEFLLASLGVPGAQNFDNVSNPLMFSAAAALNPASLGTLLPLNPAHLETQFTDLERTSYDVFADASYDVTDKLTLTGGLRLTKEEISTSGFGQLTRGNPFLGGALNALNFESTFIFVDDAARGGPRARSEDIGTEATWRLNAAYRVNKDLNTWIAYGRGRRPEVLTFNGTGVDLIDAEILDNIEVGMFARFLNGSAQLSSSIYYSEYDNFQTTFFDPDTGVATVANAGNATQYGLELDGQYIVNGALRLLATYSYNNSEFDDTDGSGNPLQFAGNTFRLSPRNSLSLAAEISLPVSKYGTLTILPSYAWRSRQFFEDDNSFDIVPDGAGGFIRTPERFFTGELVNETQDSYGELDVKVTFDHASDKWSVYVFAENLTDEEFLIDGGNTGGNIGDQHSFIRGLPRTYGLGVTGKF